MTSANQELLEIVTIRENIYQIPAIKPGSHVYVIKGANKNILIDTGIVTRLPVLQARLNEIGLAPNDIDLVVLTHEHIDHARVTIFFSKPERDMRHALRYALSLFEDSRLLFQAIGMKKEEDSHSC